MRFSEINRKIVEGYKLQLERDKEMLVLNITDTATGKRTEVRGKPGYETNGYDKNDKLHQLLDKISKTANISELMNGEVVGINPKHPDGASAKSATDKAFNEATEMKISDLTISDAGMAIAHSAGGGSRTDAPLAVTKLPSGYVYLVNGYHRLVDAMNSGKDTVSVEYVPYEKVEILWKQEREQDIKYGKQFNENFADGASAKKATDVAFNENVSALASELESKYNLKSLFLGDMASRNAIELHSIIVNREDQGKGTGSKVMQELIKYADDNGKIMVLDPGLLDKQHGTTSQSRLRKFYKQFGFIDNKGRNKNYEFRNLMIRYPQSNESVNEVSKEEFDAIRNGYVDIEFDKKWWPLSSDYPLIKHIGEAIGATSWTSWGKVGVPWSEKEMIGGGGTYMLKGDFGHILLDASKSFRPDKILMSQISTSKRGGGVGVKVMNAIKSYADQKGLPLTIYKVTNKKFFDKFEWLTKTGEDTYEYNSSKNESINEAFDNPYPFKLTGPDESQSFVATAQTPNGPLIMEFSSTDFDDFGIDFAVGNSMGKTDSGDEFRVFATVVAMMKKWISTVGIEHVEGFDFGANKGEHASDGRAKLYTRFAKKLASQLGWKLEQSTTGNGDTAFFRLVNPKPIPRDDEYWDALEENVIESAGVGRVVKGVNTTVDVGPNEIINQVKKYGNDVDRNGKPNKHLR